ncbi:unnamed protein product [Plutella xylostella]|uniref:(diamondback moth) hypothetical protein n=1 Tax=Plutella xylostella TaxID=51655 RepID=A0A8S4EL79_PLUXY|nr:unnamed protein product [Plutella xylostella]
MKKIVDLWNDNGRWNFFITLKPKSVEVLFEETPQPNGAIIGPLLERTRVDITCVVREGKPQPKVVWLFNGKERLDAKTTTPDNSTVQHTLQLTVTRGELGGQLRCSVTSAALDGAMTSDVALDVRGILVVLVMMMRDTETVQHTLQLTVTRGELGGQLRCSVTSAALDGAMTSDVSLDVRVPPNKISVSGVGEHVTHGTLVTLVCAVSGAKPAATLAWYNGSEAVDHTTRDVKDSRPKDLVILSVPLSFLHSDTNTQPFK